MAAPFLYADFIKIIDDMVIHNPITIVAMAEERGLLKERLTEVLGQEDGKDHVEEVKKQWSVAMGNHFPKSEKKVITIDVIRSRAQNAIRRRRSRLPKDLPADGLASNSQPGLYGYRWKQLVPQDCWDDDEWETFQAFLAALEKQPDEESAPREQVVNKRRPPVLVVPALVSFTLLVMLCLLGRWEDQGQAKTQKIAHDAAIRSANSRLAETFNKPTISEIRMSPSDYVSHMPILAPKDPRPLNWDDLASNWQPEEPFHHAKRDRPGLFIAGFHFRNLLDLNHEGG